MNGFRELARKNKKISESECITLLERETRGVLSVNGDNGYPYGMPMNHYYNAADGCLYFHCGKYGHRLNALKNDPKVSFCVTEKGIKADGDWAYTVRSVIVFGKIEIISDQKIIADISRALSLKFTSDEGYIEKEIEQFAKATLILKLTPEHICGKKVTES
jgi:nitroimidazol reductase NimA-like FMN-containing flavoprotein (pyridoxamine 5'-phosphate oxidase superfamily)